MVSGFIREYGGVVWTNHALEGLEKRRIGQADALRVMRRPDKTFPGKKEGSVKFIRTVKGRKIHVVGVLNEQKKWVVTSVWVRGEEDKLVWEQRVMGWVIEKIKIQISNVKMKYQKSKRG